MEKLAGILQQQYRGQNPRHGGRGAAEAAGVKLAKSNSVAAPAGSNRREVSEVAQQFYSTSFSRGNNTHFFHPYARQKSPEDVYRFLGTVDVTDLSEAVKNIPEVGSVLPSSVSNSLLVVFAACFFCGVVWYGVVWCGVVSHHACL